MSSPLEQKSDNATENEDIKIDRVAFTDQNLKQWILDTDIRIVICAETHSDTRTHIPRPLVTGLRDIIQSVYLEHSVDTTNPEQEYNDFQKLLSEHYGKAQATDNDHNNDDIKEDEEDSDHGSIYGDKDTSSPETTIDFLTKLTAAKNIHPFGCNGHEFTRETLTSAAKAATEKKITLVSIGSDHILKISDPVLMEDILLRPNPSSGTGDSDLAHDVVDRSRSEEATLIDSREGMEAISSFGLLDYLANTVDYGILVVNGSWTESRTTMNFMAERHGLALNQSMLKLGTRLKGNKKIYLAKNFLDWDEDYFNLIRNNRQIDLFEKYETFLKSYVPEFIYENLFQIWFPSISKAYHDEGNGKNQSKLYFTTLQHSIPGARDPLTVIKFAEERSDSSSEQEDSRFVAEQAENLFDE